MKVNRKWYMDKLHACWLGKNIGGTMGTPYEGKTEMQDIDGFNSPKGEPLGNDDLDLQLIWLCAVEERGIRNVTPQMLSEYWINYIPPHWNEYGIGKANAKMGLLPPYGGEINNEKWKHSNGAWIRTEIWACLFPGFPQLAVRYAYNDASVDHGLAEGTNAAMFVAALESAAFFEKDIRKLIDIGLSYIPKDCRIAKVVNLVLKLYDDGVDFKKARELVVKDSEDLGWFQAPANIGFVIIGLLYGECDFKKSMIYAIDCGDDTDCTGATVGSILGIMYGSEGIPQDWAEYIGDKIVSVAIDLSKNERAKDCTELSRRIYEQLPSVMMAYQIFMEYTDGENEWGELPPDGVTRDWWDADIPENPLSFDLMDMIYAKGRVELSKAKLMPGETVTVTFVFKNILPEPKMMEIDLTLPEGFTCEHKSINTYLHSWDKASVSVDITAGETLKSVNIIYARVSSPGRPTQVVAPIIIFG